MKECPTCRRFFPDQNTFCSFDGLKLIRSVQNTDELQGGQGQRQIPPPPKPVPLGRVPRVARLMALAIRFNQFIHEGLVADYASLARLGHVSRARISQIMNLLLLAPDIQEQILFLPRTRNGRDPMRLARLQPMAMQAKMALWTTLSPQKSRIHFKSKKYRSPKSTRRICFLR